jgi:hypothetical protein
MVINPHFAPALSHRCHPRADWPQPFQRLGIDHCDRFDPIQIDGSTFKQRVFIAMES